MVLGLLIFSLSSEALAVSKKPMQDIMNDVYDGNIGALVITGTAAVTFVSGSTFTVTDARYEGQVSTMTAGILNTSGNIVVTGNVWGWSFSSFGGDSSYTTGKMSGTYPIPEDYTDNETGLVQPLVDPTFAFILTSGTSLQFRINVTQ